MAASTRPDVLTYMTAYDLLEVPYTADSSQVRRAYLRLVREHHPDRQPARSIEQQQATERLAKINDAYALVRDAPLRFHRVSRGSNPEMPWEDAEMSDALNRAQMSRKVDVAIAAALVIVMVIVTPILASGFASALPAPAKAPVLMMLGLGSSILLWSMLGPRSWQTLLKIQLALFVLRLLVGRFH